MDLRPGRGALIHGGKFVLGLGETYTWEGGGGGGGGVIHGGNLCLV